MVNDPITLVIVSWSWWLGFYNTQITDSLFAGDLKSKNVLLTKNAKTAKLLDVGVSKLLVTTLNNSSVRPPDLLRLLTHGFVIFILCTAQHCYAHFGTIFCKSSVSLCANLISSPWQIADMFGCVQLNKQARKAARRFGFESGPRCLQQSDAFCAIKAMSFFLYKRLLCTIISFTKNKKLPVLVTFQL